MAAPPTQSVEKKDAPATGAAKNRDEAKRAPGKRRRALLVGIPVALVAVAIAVALYIRSRHYESTDDAFIDGRATAVSPKVAAHVVELLVDDNQDVVAGQLLLTLDPSDFETRLAQARAQGEAAKSRLASAEAGVAHAESDVKSAEADVAAAETEAERAATDLERYESAGTAVTKQSVDFARAAARSTAAQLRAAREKLTATRSDIPLARAQVAVAKAEIEQANARFREAELQLSYTKIRAPVAGRVTRRSVEVGAYVQPGESLLALVEKDLWVVANFRETQLAHMRVGQPVEIEIDAFPDRKIAGKVESFMRGTGSRFSLLPPENATGNYVKVVQRVPVKIVFTEKLPADREIGVGMSVVPRVTVR